MLNVSKISRVGLYANKAVVIVFRQVTFELRIADVLLQLEVVCLCHVDILVFVSFC